MTIIANNFNLHNDEVGDNSKLHMEKELIGDNSKLHMEKELIGDNSKLHMEKAPTLWRHARSCLLASLGPSNGREIRSSLQIR